MASPRHRDETNTAYAHSAENYEVSYASAFTNFDGVDSTFKQLAGNLRATMN
jgi:hypothetical protein